ncbi:hypothetical protein QJS10_CPB17g02519 [Acorus calamus]|uniref:Uncharacterized protein n=1 Tax=Acorus calamus TaxID=4465 RepID=A0AAV9CRX0_ACOCL|nr:hypothetical protein QJS10_CPB17g02519 [Acorus calamus]
MKESHLKEMEFRLSHFELENEELRGSLCEFREAQINEVGAAASLKKLRQKYKSLEKEHGKCITEIQTKKAEWVCQMKNLENDLNKCQSESISRGEKIQELQVELESSYSSMMQLQLQTEELFVELMVLKSKVSEAQESTFTHRQEISARDGSSSDAEQQCYMMQKEIERYEEMLDDSVRCCDLLKEEACQKENALRNDLKKASDALVEANSSLSQKLLEEKNTKFELDRWKSVAKTLEISKLNAETQLKACFDEIREIRREFEDAVLTKMEIEKAFNQEKQSLTQIAEEKGKKISDLQEQLMQQECARREVEAALLVEMEATEIHEQEKQMFLQVIEKRAKEVEDFEQRIVMLEEKSEFLILSRIETEKKFVQEKVNFLHMLEEKEEKMDCLQQEVDLLEQEITQNEIVAAVVSANITEKTFEQEKEMFCRIAKEKDEKLESLQQHIDMLEKEVFKREILAILSVQSEAENSFEQEKQHYIRIREEKDKEMDDLIQERNRRMEANIFAKSEREKTLEQEKQHFVKIKAEMCEEIDRLREHIILLEEESDRRQKEKERFCQIAKEKDEKLESLQQHIDMLEKEVFKREILAILSVQSEAENSFEQEKQHYIRIREEKDKEMDDLIQERNRRMEANIFAKSETEKTLEQEKQHFVKIKAKMCEEIDRLREHIILLEEESDRRQKEKERFCQIAKEKDEKLESLQQHIDMLEKEVFKREILAILSVQLEAENSFEQEKQHYIQIREEKDKEMDDLIQEHNRRMEANIFAKSETEKTLEQEKQHLFKIKAEMCEEIDRLREHIILLEEESDRRQKEASACTIELENIIQREKTRSLQILEEKDEMIDDLQQQVFALTWSIETAVTLACKEKEKEIDRLREAWEQIRAACILSDVQVHFSYILVSEVEKEIDNLEQKIYMEEKLSTETKQELERLKVKWETDMSEIEREKDQLEDSRRAAEHLHAELECKLKASHEKNVKLSLEKEELVWQMDEFCNQIGQLTHEDEELMTSLEKVLHRADAKGEENFGSKKPDELLSSESKVGLHHERRSPLKELNT